MVLINFSSKELTGKIVYYGPGLCGKTTNLQYIYRHVAPRTRGQFVSLSTDEDRTLFFDFLPLDLGTIRGMKTRFQLYTVPGQVFYNETRKVVVRGSDAIVFVADSQRERFDANLESLDNMKENLLLNDLNPETIPLVFQYNKRDLQDISSIDEMNRELNWRGVPFFTSVATKGTGVMESFKSIGKLLMLDLQRNYRPKQTTALKRPVPSSPTPKESPREDKNTHGAVTVENSAAEVKVLEGSLETMDSPGEAEAVAMEEVSFHTHRLSWFSIDGDTLKRDDGEESSEERPQPDRENPESEEIEPECEIVSTQQDFSDITGTASQPPPAALPPSVRDERSRTGTIREDLARLQTENTELKNSQQELIKLMTDLKSEIRSLRDQKEDTSSDR